MEFIEICGCLLECGDLAVTVVDIVAYYKSEPNRQARKNARAIGTKLPPMNWWLMLFVLATPIAITLTALVIYKYTR